MGDSNQRPSSPTPTQCNEPNPTESSSNDAALASENKDAQSLKRKRTVVHVACLACRRLRIKCDGERPTCLPCARRYETCQYDVAANTTRSNALKSKNEQLNQENAQLRELYSFLRNRPLIEAEEIFRRIRNTQDPLDVFRHVAMADLLIKQGGPTASTAEHREREDGFDHSQGYGWFRNT